MSNGNNPNGPIHPNGINLNHPAVAIALIICQLFQFMFQTYIVTLANRNHETVKNVEHQQVEVQEKQDVAAVKADVAAVKATEVKKTLEAGMEAESRNQGINLYMAWKYLEDVASVSGDPRDKAKAAEAKKAYEDHLKKNNNHPKS